MAFAANAYAEAESKAVQEQYVQRFRFDQRITKPGAVGYLRLDGWPSDVRFMVEPSLGTEDSLFLSWTTRFPADEFSEISDKITHVFEQAAGVYGLKFRPLV